MPELGEIKRGGDIDKYPIHKYIWHACINCGKERWVILRHKTPTSLQCQGCSQRYGHGGTGHINDTNGYIKIPLNFSDPLYSMVDNRGYILEHRLVMAKHLGRCLQSNEVLHHKNKNKQDNRIENLELLSRAEHRHNHSILTTMV